MSGYSHQSDGKPGPKPVEWPVIDIITGMFFESQFIEFKKPLTLGDQDELKVLLSDGPKAVVLEINVLRKRMERIWP